MPTLRHCESADDLHGTVKIGYEVHNGDAAASWVVFVAGVAAPRGMWDRQVAALAPTTGAVTVDNRGIGDRNGSGHGTGTTNVHKELSSPMLHSRQRYDR